MISGANINGRDSRLDAIKGICIILMVWAHLPSMGSWAPGLIKGARWIYTFHMPIFCLVSGWLFGLKRGESREFSLVVNRMLKPYCTMSIISYVLYWCAAKYGFSTTVQMPLEPYRILLGHGGGALWYLYTFGIVELAVLFSQNLSNRMGTNGTKESCLLILLLAGGVSVIMRALGFNVWAHMVPLFLVGLFARKVDVEPLRCGNLITLIASVYVIFCIIFLGLSMQPVQLFLFQLSVFAILIRLAEWLILLPGIGSLLCFIGRHTLEILLFHNIVSVGLRPASKIILQYEGSGFCLNILMCFSIMTACLIIGFVLRRIALGDIFLSLKRQ